MAIIPPSLQQPDGQVYSEMAGTSATVRNNVSDQPSIQQPDEVQPGDPLYSSEAGGFLVVRHNASDWRQATSAILAKSVSNEVLCNTVIYGTATVCPLSATDTLQQRLPRIDDYAERVVALVRSVESGNEGERNIRFQQARQFLEPAGYFSAGLLAAGYDPHEKITVTFNTYVGRGNPDKLTSSHPRTYFAWEIAAGALAHDKVERGGPINFQSMHIEQKDRSKVSDLESAGEKLQHHWEREISGPLSNAWRLLATRSGKADAYVVRGTLQSLANDKNSFDRLSHDAKEAVNRTVQRNGQVIVPNIYGYPLAGYAFIPYHPFDGNVDNRPNTGLMIDLKNGTVNEIKGDGDFASWAKQNRDPVLRSFNADDKQGGKDAHWPKAGDVLDDFIAGNHATFPGRSGLLSDKAVPVWETFNYTQSRDSDYTLKFGGLYSSIAGHYEEVNANNAIASDRAEVFGSSQQEWKAAKEFWGNTFGYLPLPGTLGNIVFGVHDSLYGMTANDRVGGTAAAVISALQLAHELAPIGAEYGVGEQLIRVKALDTEHYSWRFDSSTSELELVRTPQSPVTADEVPASVTAGPEITPALDAPLSFPGMREIKFRGRTYYAAYHPDAGDGVHYLLRIPDARDPQKLGSSGKIAAPDEANVWRLEGKRGGGTVAEVFSRRYRQAREALEVVIEKYKHAATPPTELETQAFAATLTELSDKSNADYFEHIETYTHADSDFVNVPLRAGRSTPELEAFLDEFNQLVAYEGKAYRSAFVTPEGAKRIKEGVGKVFQDPGVQSASTTVHNSIGWEDWAKRVAGGRNNAKKQVVYVFDELVPKKNLSADLMKDHVAIGPREVMKIMAVKEFDDKLFVYISSPSKTPDHIYNIFNGEIIY